MTVGNIEVESQMDYDEWQLTLSAEFFSMNRRDEPVIMFLNDEELARICPFLQDPVGSLRSAVLAELRQTDKPAVFEPVERRVTSWRKGPQDQPPPCLPLLALTVIAGSRMRHDGTFSAAAYYPRLIDLMTTGTNRVTAIGVKKHFNVVAEMWETVDAWIERRSDIVGPSTIRTHETFNRIGYPLSQTVMKASDQDRLSEFFDRLRVDPNSMPVPEQLLALLQLWLDKPRGFSPAFVDLVQKGSGNALLLAVISKLASEQSVGAAAATSRVRLDLCMRIDPVNWSVDWVIPIDPRLETDEFRQDGGSHFTINTPEYGSVYDVAAGSLPQGVVLINRRFKAAGSRAVLTKKVHQMWILRIDPLSGHWQSVPYTVPDEVHLFVVADADVAEMDELLSKSAASGYWKLRGQVFPGWAVYVDVSLVEPIDLSATGAFNGLGQLLKSSPNSKPRLANGLELRTDVGGRHYLLGGEPDVQLPEESVEKYVHIILDKRLPGTRVKANGSLFPLRLAGPFAEGKHAVTVAGHALEFFVHSTGSAARWEAAHVDDQDDVLPPCLVPDSRALKYVLCRRGRDAALWFITPSGLVRRNAEPPIPSFITELGFPESYQWKASIPEDATWVLPEQAGKFLQPQRITAEPPNFGSIDGHARAFWRRAARETIDNTDRVWRSYLSQSMEGSIYGR